MAQTNDKSQKPALRKTAVIGSGFSIWETMTQSKLKEIIN